MSFLEPLFLVAILAGLVPVVLHMIHRHKATEIPFSTLRFLRISVQRTRRRKHFEDLFLLLVRALVLALIAVGLAQPVMTSLGFTWGGGRARGIVIILDNSASMGLMDGGTPRFETARKAAEQILDMLHDGDAVAFLPTGGPVSPEQGKLVHAQEAVRHALARCKVSYERADLAGKLHQARELLDKSDFLQKEVYLITDNQVISWEGVKERGGGEATENETPLILVKIGNDPQANVALRSVRLESPAPAVGVPITAVVELVNGSAIPQQRNLELYLNGRKEAGSPTLNISPLATIRHEFRFTLDRTGVRRGEIRLAEEDGCSQDNRLFFVVNVDQQIPVAIVKPRQMAIALTDDAFYLEQVLAPTGGEGWSIRPEVITVENLGQESLSRFAVVYCVNLPALDAERAVKLKEYVVGGGHLFWICGDNTVPEAYQRMNEQADGRILPASLKPLRVATQAKAESWKIAYLDKDHRALSGLTEPASLYQSVLVHKHFPLTSPEGSSVRVLAKLEDGQPLLVESKVGSGSVLMLGTGVHVDWTNLPLRPIFLPLMARLTFRLAGIEGERAQVVAGAPLAVPLPGQQEDAEIEIVNPTGDLLRVNHAMKDSRIFRYPQTHAVGTYLVRLTNARPAKQFAFAVNLDPEECDPAILGTDELRKRFGSELVICDNPADVAGTIQRLREGRGLRDLFLVAVLISLLLESYLANCRGSARAAS